MANDASGITILEINQDIESRERTTGALVLYATELALDLSDEFDCSQDMTFALVGYDLRTDPDDLTFLEERDSRTDLPNVAKPRLDREAK